MHQPAPVVFAQGTEDGWRPDLLQLLSLTQVFGWMQRCKMSQLSPVRSRRRIWITFWICFPILRKARFVREIEVLRSRSSSLNRLEGGGGGGGDPWMFQILKFEDSPIGVFASAEVTMDWNWSGSHHSAAATPSASIATCFLGDYSTAFFSSHHVSHCLPSRVWSCFLTEWPGLETTFRVCWAQGMEGPSATVTAMGRPCPQVASPRLSSRPKRSVPAPWPCTTPSRSGRTASPSTGPSSSLVRTTLSGSTPRKSLSGHILFCLIVKMRRVKCEIHRHTQQRSHVGVK